MKVSAKNLKKCIDNLAAVEAKLEAMPLHRASNIGELTEIYGEKYKVIQYFCLGFVNFRIVDLRFLFVFADIARNRKYDG